MAENKMLKFVKLEREMPTKRGADERAHDFDEIYADFLREKAADQAGRCSQCGVPYCQTHCPLHNNIPDWLRLTAEGRMQEAYELAQSTNTFPEICGRICPQDRLCEGNCVIEQSGHGTVTIGAVEKHIVDNAWAQGWVKPPHPHGPERPETVGIVGAGPAGLAAAERLRKAGLQVTVYDRHDRAGGLMIYGIPGFKLEKHVVTRRSEQLAEAGVCFELNCEIGRDISFAELRARHNAVLIATGVYKSRALDLEGEDRAGVVRAIDYLIASNRTGLGDEVADFTSGALNAAGKRVVVIGGGDTAMDCVRTAVRQGAASVKCLYRRDRDNMPGSQREVANAEEEGVEFQWLTAPLGFEGEPVTNVRVAQMRLGAPDVSGRRAPEPVPDGAYEEPADLVIKALGFSPEDLPTQWQAQELSVTNWGTVRAEFTSGRTAIPGVYAAGDIVRGASLVVWAIRDGRDAADAILSDLNAAASSHVAAE